MLIFGIRPGRWQSLGVSIGLAGAVALVLLRPGGGFQADYEYAILPLIATMNYAFNANYVKLKLPWMNPLELTAVSIAMAGLLSVPPLFLLTDITQVVASHAYGWEALGYTLILGFVGTGITKGLFYKLVPLSDAVFATSISSLLPVVALFWGGLAGEPLGWLHLVALVAILLGIYLISKPVKTGPEATAANASAPALETDAARD